MCSGPQCHAQTHISGPGWILGSFAAFHRWCHCQVWWAAADQKQPVALGGEPGKEGETAKTVSTDSHSLLFPESHQQPWNNNCAPSGAQAIDNSLPSHSVLGSSFCSPLVSAQLVQQCFSFSPEAASPCSFKVKVGLWCWMLVSWGCVRSSKTR